MAEFLKRVSLYPIWIQDKMDSSSVLSLEYVDFETPVEFEQPTADTFGLVEKFGKFQLGIVADNDTLDKVDDLSARYETMYPIKGRVFCI